MWEEARIVLHGLGTAQASAHRIVESPIKSIRVLKGMQQCEDFAPPPEPSGQRKQTAVCILCRGVDLCPALEGCGKRKWYTRAASSHVNLVALVDWRFIKLHKRQPGERDIPVPAKARPGSESRWVGGNT